MSWENINSLIRKILLVFYFKCLLHIIRDNNRNQGMSPSSKSLVTLGLIQLS